jgi:hypothetical protein
MARIFLAFRGQERLAFVFWAYCIFGCLIFGVLMFWIFRLFPVPHRTLGNLVTGILFVLYFLWAHISLWRCAFNFGRRGWGYAARCYAVVIVLCYFTGIAANFGSGPPGIQRVF